MKVARGAFLEVLREQAVRRINEKNPRKEIYTESAYRLEPKWEENYKRKYDRAQKLVKAFSVVEIATHH